VAAKKFSTTKENLLPDDHLVNDTLFKSPYINDGKAPF
jgi:hypothetical protein